MLAFELSAIDLILVITVIALLVLYWTKLSKINEEQIIMETKPTEKNATNTKNNYTECPRGFGYIKKITDDGSVSEKCLGCYRIMECYGDSEKTTPQLNPISQ